MKSIKQIRFHILTLFPLSLILLCCATPGIADNYTDRTNAVKKGDLKELSRISAMAYEFSIEDTHLSVLPAPIAEAIRHGNDFKDGACSLVGKPINLIEKFDNSGYAATTSDACQWKSKPGQTASGAVGPIWVVRNGEHPELVFAGEGRLLTLNQIPSQNGLPQIGIATGVAGRFIENAWTYNGKTYVPVNECGTDDAMASSYCMAKVKTIDLNSSEDKLNQAYKLLREAFSSPSFSAPKSAINALTIAERNWVKQRELDCSLEYLLLNIPKEERRQNLECLSRLADQRTIYLNEIRDCIITGDGDQKNCPSY